MTGPSTGLDKRLDALRVLLDIPKELLRAICEDYGHLDVTQKTFGLREIALATLRAPSPASVDDDSALLQSHGLARQVDSGASRTRRLYVAKQDEAGLDRPREYDWWQCQWRTLGQVIQELSAFCLDYLNLNIVLADIYYILHSHVEQPEEPLCLAGLERTASEALGALVRWTFGYLNLLASESSDLGLAAVYQQAGWWSRQDRLQRRQDWLVWRLFHAWQPVERLLDGKGILPLDLHSGVNSEELVVAAHRHRDAVSGALTRLAKEEDMTTLDLSNLLRAFKYDWAAFYAPPSVISSPDHAQKLRILKRLLTHLNDELGFCIIGPLSFLWHEVLRAVDPWSRGRTYDVQFTKDELEHIRLDGTGDPALLAAAFPKCGIAYLTDNIKKLFRNLDEPDTGTSNEAVQ